MLLQPFLNLEILFILSEQFTDSHAIDIGDAIGHLKGLDAFTTGKKSWLDEHAFQLTALLHCLLFGYRLALHIVIAIDVLQEGMRLPHTFKKDIGHVFIAISVGVGEHVRSSKQFHLMQVGRHIVFGIQTCARIEILM